MRPIYKKDENGAVSLIVEALREQFLKFLDQLLRDMEEKKQKLEEQRRWQVAMAEELLRTARDTESKKGKDDPDGPNR